MMKTILKISLVALIACSPSKNNEVDLRSIETHEAAMKIGQEMREHIEQLDLKAQTLEEPQKTVVADSILKFKEDLAYWDALMSESPVPEQDHDDHSGHDHDHDHDHGPAPDLTPEMILEIQQDLHDQAIALNNRIKSLSSTIEE